MKRIFTLLPFLLAVFCLTGCTNGALILPNGSSASIRSEAAFLYNMESDVLAAYPGEDVRIRPASLTKLLTALTALDVMDPSAVITPGEEVYLPGTGSSSAFIRPHHALSLEMLVEAMLLPSGNDAAYAAAAACGRVIAENPAMDYTDAVQIFVGEMNRFAQSLGCTDSHFTVPDGYAGEENYSTPGDMAKIARAAAHNEIILRYAGMHRDDVTYASGHTNTWVNTNLQLDPDSRWYNPNVTGLKTGSLPDSFSLITLYDDGSSRLLIGIFEGGSDSDRYGDTGRIIEEFTKQNRRSDPLRAVIRPRSAH